MNFFIQLFSKPSRETQIEGTVTEIIGMIMNDEISDFTHQEQSEIVQSIVNTFKTRKRKERSNLNKYAQSIDDCLDQLTRSIENEKIY